MRWLFWLGKGYDPNWWHVAALLICAAYALYLWSKRNGHGK